ncbi:MAG: CbiX/SirB N-terminal domain-containing protein [Aquificota bacterium]|nr:CbiX/SirB N-terminal domain-containing protein [Aquificota bacterium]
MVLQALEPLRREHPVEVAFGMADPTSIKTGIENLEREGVDTIVVIPLFISSHSPIMEQIEYLLGVRKEYPSKPVVMIRDPALLPFWEAIGKLPWHVRLLLIKDRELVDRNFFESLLDKYRIPDRERLWHLYNRFREIYENNLNKLRPLKTRASILLTQALDDHPVVSEILGDRAWELSRDPANETLIIVAHGPTEESYNRRWIKNMESIARRCQELTEEKFGKPFKNVFSITVRDDAPEPIYKQAEGHLRALVRQAGEGGTVIVVPLLLAPGVVEKGIEERLEGLDYRWSGKTLLPDERIVRFIEDVNPCKGVPSSGSELPGG